MLVDPDKSRAIKVRILCRNAGRSLVLKLFDELSPDLHQHLSGHSEEERASQSVEQLLLYQELCDSR
jgi:hypothetical protein